MYPAALLPQVCSDADSPSHALSRVRTPTRSQPQICLRRHPGSEIRVTAERSRLLLRQQNCLQEGRTKNLARVCDIFKLRYLRIVLDCADSLSEDQAFAEILKIGMK